MPRIERFKDGYDFLSNFHPCDIWYENVLYYSLEAAYQAAKSTDDDEREDIRCAPTPGKAKKLGRAVKHLRPDWDKVKFSVMEDLVRQKFQDPTLRKQLLDTKDYELVEGNTWGDICWGQVYENKQWIGENNLGKILMKVRDECRNANTQPD